MLGYSLKLERIRRSQRAALRLARWVAGLIGIAIALAAPAYAPYAEDLTPQAYAKTLLSTHNYKCLSKLYGKESAWRHDAVGNLAGKQKAYGIPQIKNDIIKDKSPLSQVDYGLKYLSKRYGVLKNGEPDACSAWAHFQRKGWH
jgi:hypothetical protein